MRDTLWCFIEDTRLVFGTLLPLWGNAMFKNPSWSLIWIYQFSGSCIRLRFSKKYSMSSNTTCLLLSTREYQTQSANTLTLPLEWAHRDASNYTPYNQIYSKLVLTQPWSKLVSLRLEVTNVSYLAHCYLYGEMPCLRIHPGLWLESIRSVVLVLH